MNFVNSWLAQVWQEETEKTRPERLLQLCLDYKRGQVPEGAILLTGGVDKQQNYFVITIRAFGVYPESWLVLEEITDKLETLEKILFEDRYPSLVPGIEPFPVSLSCLDTGYNTSEMYDLCRRYKGFARAIKGKDQLTGVPYRVTNIDKYPNSGRHIPGGLLLYLLDTSYFKDKISRMVHAEEPTCKWHLHKNPSPDYLRQFCGEHKVLKLDKKRGRAYEIWQPVSSHAATHFWDAEVYAMAAAEMLRVYNLREEDIPKPSLFEPAVKEEQKKESWIGQRNNWIRHK
jgi:phage terminase large subunit GpA-like protein